MKEIIDKFFKNIDKNQLIFDMIVALLISLTLSIPEGEAASLINSVHPAVVIIFAFIIQASLSFNLGMIIKRFRKQASKRAMNMIGIMSVAFIFPMLFFSGAAMMFEIGIKGSAGGLIAVISFAVILTAYILGEKFSSWFQDMPDKKEKAKKIVTVFSAMAFAYLNYGVALFFKGSSKEISISSFLVFLGLMVFLGILPFRGLMALAPPKNKTNIKIAVTILLYDLLLLYFNSIQQVT
jgi:hypothetical protein